MADKLATAEDLASILQDSAVDASTADLLLECATAVVQAAAGGQRIVQVEDDEVTLYLDDYDDVGYLTLPQRPVTAVSTVLIGETAVTDYYPQFSRNRLYRADGWRSTLVLYGDQPSTVTVTYTHGYAPGDQRLQLARSATLMLASRGYVNPTGAIREQSDDYAVQYAEMVARMEAHPNLTRSLRAHYGSASSSVRLIKR